MVWRLIDSLMRLKSLLSAVVSVALGLQMFALLDIVA